MNAKYRQLFSLSWQTRFAYLATIIVWRLRQFLTTFMSLSVWGVLFINQENISHYSRNEIFTYIFLVSILQSIVTSSALYGLASTLYSGEFSQILMKPINKYLYLLTTEVAEKLYSVFFAVIEFGVLFVMIQPQLSLPAVSTLGILFGWVLGAVFLFFFVQLLLGAIGFWSPDNWAFQFLFGLILEISAGKMFPLDILPHGVHQVIRATPFPYFSFVQSQLFLGKLNSAEIITHSGLMLFWIFILGIITHKLWKKGLLNYEATGQ